VKILFLGDVVGRSGRDAILSSIKKIRNEYQLDVVIVNVDNAAGGFGTNASICKEMFAAGVDVLTGGDHVWDQKDIAAYLATEKKLLRPQNYPQNTVGTGHHVLEVAGKKILILHLLGQIFIRDQVACPFACADDMLKTYRLGTGGMDAIVVDFHAEATSEKTAMGLYLDGRVSMVVGSHTHIPTADARVLPGGTAYQTDSGMCGDYDSVIGFAKEGPLERFLSKRPKIKMDAAQGAARLCGLMVETDDKTGLARSCRAFVYPNF
jgi:metallophosphoesterase (TIGR00282 family)